MSDVLIDSAPIPVHVSKRIFGNLGYLLSGRAAAGVVSLIYMIIAARVLGPESYGLLVLIHAFAMTIGGVIALPGWHGLVRFGVGHLEKGDQQQLARLGSWLGIIEFSGGIAAVLSAALLAPIVGRWLGWTAEAESWFPLYSLAVLASVRGTPGGYLQLIRRFDLIALHNLVTPAIRLVGSCAAAILDWGLPGFLAVWLTAAIAEGTALWAIAYVVSPAELRQKLTFLGLSNVPRDNPGLVRFGLTANADLAVSGFAGWATPLILGGALGAVGAGWFAIAQRVTIIFVQPAQLLGQAAYAELVRVVHLTNDRLAVRHALWHSIRTASMIALPVMLLLAVFSRQIVHLIAGQAYLAAAPLLVWLCISRAVSLISPSISAALTAIGHPGFSLSVNILTGAVFLAALPAFINQWGFAGAGMHAVVQSAVAVLTLGGGLLWTTRENAPN
jgi:O-antigen/teichoic acid export membrane protein